MLLKTASYYVIHICVAAMVALRRDGQFARVAHPELAGATVQAAAFFHEKALGANRTRRWRNLPAVA